MILTTPDQIKKLTLKSCSVDATQYQCHEQKNRQIRLQTFFFNSYYLAASFKAQYHILCLESISKWLPLCNNFLNEINP